MSKTKRILAFALAAVLAVVVLSGCKSIAQKVFGSSNEVQEDDTTQWAVLSSDPLVIDGIADTTAKYATARANGALNIVFNGIWSRQTEYFTVPSGLLSIYGCGISMRECFVCVFISADALHFHQTVEVVTAGIVGNGNAVACVGVKVVDVAVVVLAVGGEIEGGVVHILRAAVHLFPEGDLELLGTAIGGDG